MRKTYYHNFLPTKAKEVAGPSDNELPTIVEIRDLNPLPPLDTKNPWQIKKRVTITEIVDEKLELSHAEVFDHIFRYWPLSKINLLLTDNKVHLPMFAYDDLYYPLLVKGPNDAYFLEWADVVRNRGINPGDEIGLFWDNEYDILCFRMLRQGD